MRKNFFKHCKNYPSLAGKIAYIYRFDVGSGGFHLYFFRASETKSSPLCLYELN